MMWERKFYSYTSRCLLDFMKRFQEEVRHHEDYVIDKLLVVGVMKNELREQRGVIFCNSGHEEFIKLIPLLFCFTQRLSLFCDAQKRVSVVTRLN